MLVKLKYIVKFIKKLEHKKTLFFISGIALLFIIIGYHSPPGSNINSLFINLGSGILTSLFFYLITIEYKTFIANIAMEKSIFERVSNISSLAKGIYSYSIVTFNKKTNSNLDLSYFDYLNIDKVLETLMFHDEIPNTKDWELKPLKLIDGIFNRYNRIIHEVDTIFIVLDRYMDPILIQKLALFRYEKNYIIFNTPLVRISANRNLEIFKEQIESLYKLGEELLGHVNKYYK